MEVWFISSLNSSFLMHIASKCDVCRCDASAFSLILHLLSTIDEDGGAAPKSTKALAIVDAA